MTTTTSIWRRIENGLLLSGTLLIGIYVVALLHGVVGSRIALWQLEHAQTVKAASADGVDTSLWSDRRIQAYKESLVGKLDAPLGVLRIPRLRLVVPVFEGTDDLTLNRGVGRIVGTAELGDRGNTGVAGHRDGFFRVLKDIAVGDSVEVAAEGQTLSYVVRSIEIVNPDDVRVLHPTDQPSLTLVTCYPFYFIGSAPQRFIVHASLLTSASAGTVSAHAASKGPR